MALNDYPLGFLISNPLTSIRGKNSWPPPELAGRWEQVRQNRGWRLNNEDTIRNFATASGLGGSVLDQPDYIPFPLARSTSDVSAQYIAGDAPIVTVEDNTDEDRRNTIIKKNSLTKKIRANIGVSSSEGGVYAKVSVDPTTPLGRQVPLITFLSEDKVIPVFIGDELVEATVVHEWEEGETLYRLFEQHLPGTINFTLRKGGSNTSIGSVVNLAASGKTSGLQETVSTGTDELLVVYIPNKRDSGVFGVSDYDGLKEMFLAVNEFLTKTQSSFRASETRLATDQKLTDKNGNLPSGANVLHANSDDSTMGENPLLEAITPTFQADAFNAWGNALINYTLTVQGLAPETFGLGVDGAVANAAAQRLKTRRTQWVMAAKAEYWEDAISVLLRLAAILDQQTYTVNGMTKQGVQWEKADAEVTVTMRDGAPMEYITSAQDLVQLKTAGLISEELAVQTLHSGFSPAEVQTELDRLDQELAAQSGSLGTAAAAAVAGLTLPPIAPPTDPANPNTQ